ncbi:hypothetical protein [Paraburkholderia phenoliruptrix]|uniref:hypothetical protein n=1 Tax=Paraburkholderia phenoliruptrix TaxID=252970 RepID=UPI001C4F3C46|nr:hypothetical protein [Paraburkholderia phenoliruptrix]MBW0445579.1 hypothetical protein [Paraburkholderia phenoliruptrix]MBW9096344.1 hypothetical protein [Paraburkholderia phenoliruptrix]
MTNNRWIRFFGLAALLLSMLDKDGLAEVVNRENETMQFSYTTNGAAEGSMNTYGNNEVSVSGDVLQVEIGDSVNNRVINGVGIYELHLSGENLEAAKRMASLLCSPKDPASDVTIPDLYTVKCRGEMRSSYIRDFSRPVAIEIFNLMNSLKNTGVRDGRKLVKLDVSPASVERISNGFIVSLRFANSGDYPIRFKTPDRWETTKGKDMDILAVNDSAGGTSSNISFVLAGQPLANAEEFPGGEVTLAPHSAVVLKIKTGRIQKFSAGTYDLHAGAFMNLEVIGIQSGLLRADFHSDYKNPTRVTFDRDYPSTPQEREQWEATHRRDMSWWPVNPGETFAEDGLYRAVRTGYSTYRSLQLVPFKAGAVATTEPVQMLMERGNGVSLNGPVQWLWEASAPTPVKQYSFDLIDETRQFCEPGSVCPRSGRWLPRTRQGWENNYRYDFAGVVTVQRGQTMPTLKESGGRASWEWVGA